jgi:hypothetical protein
MHHKTRHKLSPVTFDSFRSNMQHKIHALTHVWLTFETRTCEMLPYIRPDLSHSDCSFSCSALLVQALQLEHTATYDTAHPAGKSTVMFVPMFPRDTRSLHGKAASQPSSADTFSPSGGKAEMLHLQRDTNHTSRAQHPHHNHCIST